MLDNEGFTESGLLADWKIFVDNQAKAQPGVFDDGVGVNISAEYLRFQLFPEKREASWFLRSGLLRLRRLRELLRAG